MNRTIAIIEPVGGHGGMDYYDYGLCLGLSHAGVNARLYTSSETKQRKYPNVTTIICFQKMWNANIIGKVFKYIKGHIFAVKDFKKQNGKIVHVHLFSFRILDLLILMIFRIYKLKVVATIHDIEGLDKKTMHFFERKALLLIDHVIVHNKTSYDSFLKKNKFFHSISIIPHGNYIPFIQTLSTEEDRGSSPFTILFFGQIKKAKGIDILIKALSMLKSEQTDVRLIIAGKPWKVELAEISHLIDSLNLGKIITTNFQYIPDSEVPHFYSVSDIVVLPYREIYQSGVLLLSMSFGKPILCSDLKAFTDIITDGYNGFLFKDGNPRDLANKITYIMQNRQLLKVVAEKSYEIVATEYDWNKIGVKNKEIYLSLG